ncbi:MAG TPA: hypothetical protein VFQ35_09660 [Polyangiaceae bacterium]|nr:hypothetical protein [Polyangiaceae bacterium]
MTALVGAVPKAKTKYYLDTSAVFALASVQAAKAGQQVPTIETQRANRLSPFLAKVAVAGGLVCTSVLAFQEVANIARRKARDEFAKQAGFSSWNHLESSAAQSVQDTVASQAHGAMLQVLEWAAVAVRDANGETEQPAVAADQTKERGQRLRKAHRRFLRAYARLDSMDALHIVIGTELGAKDFISFDKAWESVTEIVVYA